MESMTTMSGATSWICENIFSKDVSQRMEIWSQADADTAEAASRSEDDYYGFVNTIIKNYTKLTPVKL